MPIAMICQSCQAKFDAADDAIGKPAPCPKCGSATTVPRPQSAKKGIPLATPAQREYALSLGIDFPENINRRDISNLIDEELAKLDRERIDRLNELERREAAIAESGGLAHATPDQMIDALANRGVTAILITLESPNGVVDFSNLDGIQVSISFTGDMTRQEMAAAIFTAATQFATKYNK
jgi:hypothetical protein